MSKSLKKVVGIAAALIVPYASPIIAGAIGLSGAVGGVLGSGLVGATLGGATTAALGGDWKKGALFGGIGGGIGGYLNPQGASTMFGIQGDPSAGAFGSAGAGGSGAGLSTSGNLAGGGGNTTLAGTGGVDTLGAAPSVTSAQGPLLEGIPEGMQMAVDTSTAYAPQTLGQKAAAVLERIKQAPGALADKVTDPKFLADVTLKAGMMLSGQALAGGMTGMLPEEQALIRAQMEDLQLMRQQNQDLYNLKMQEAQKMLNEAEYFDPTQLGMQAARQEQVRSGLATTEGLRGIRDESKRQAEARRFALVASKNAGTAFEQGQQTGIAGRLQSRQAGLSALPTPAAFTSYANLANAYGNQYERERQGREDVGSFIGGLLPDRSTGDNDVGYGNIFRGIG
jgi:hypothetical protein